MDDDYSGVSDSSSESSTTTIPAASSNAILMLSLPDTPQEEQEEEEEEEEEEDNDAADADDIKTSADQDVFETPPEYALVPTTSQEKTPVLDLNRICNDDYDDEESDPEELGDVGEANDVVVAVGGAVDLDRDTDLAESESEIRVLKRDSPSPDEAESSSSSPLKKSRVSEGDLGNSEEELETEPLSLSNHSSNSEQTLPMADHDDVKSVEQKSVENPQNSGSESDNAASEETQPVTEESGSRYSMEYSSQDCSDVDSMEALWSADSDGMRSEGRKWSDLLDVLKFLKEKSGEARNEVNNCSFLEIAKRRGMTFPRL